ncbi:MAG: TetR/AcrR family transcriptional regulator [Thermincolia bacterium]
MKNIKKGDSKRSLLDAAYIIFSRNGYEKATIDDIAKEAGYTKGAFYWHFSSKEQLFLKLVDHRFNIQQQHFLEKLDLNLDIKDNVAKLFLEMIKLTRDDNWAPMFIEFLAQASRNPEVRKKVSIMYQNWRKFIVDLLLQLQQKDPFSIRLNPFILSSLLIATFDGINMQIIAEPDLYCEEDLLNILEILFMGLEIK